MKKRLLAAGLLLYLAALVWAQDGSYAMENRKKGSQSIELSPGGFLPLFVLDSTYALYPQTNMNPGAVFGIQYRYMLSPHIAVGGSLSGSFVTTIGGRTLFLAPICATASWLGGSDALEFDLSLEAGLNIMRLSGNGLISPIVKAGAGLSRYISDAWSIGGRFSWWFVPELHTGAYANLNSYGNFLEFGISARYHF